MYNYKIFSDDELDKDQQEVMEKLGQIDKKYSLEEFTPNEITSLGLESCINSLNYIQGVSTLFYILEIQKGK